MSGLLARFSLASCTFALCFLLTAASSAEGITQKFKKVQLYVSNDPAMDVINKIKSMTKLETLVYLRGLQRFDKNVSLPPIEGEQSIIVSIFDTVPAGTEFQFRYKLKTSKNNPMYEASKNPGMVFKDIPVKTDPLHPTYPTIIVNGVWTLYNSEYDLRLLKNGRRLARWNLSFPGVLEGN